MAPRGGRDLCASLFLLLLLLVVVGAPRAHLAVTPAVTPSVTPPWPWPCPHPCACYAPTELHCTFRSLVAVPAGIRARRRLIRINLGFNSIQALSATSFAAMSRLELLMLHGNEISAIPDGALRDLGALQVLKLSYNRLRALTRGSLRGLRALVRLHADHNAIEFLEPGALAAMPALRLLQLEGNALTRLHPAALATATADPAPHRPPLPLPPSGLRHLYLADNRLRRLPDAALDAMPLLENLYLHGNPWECGCRARWFLRWRARRSGMLKCKKDKTADGGQICAVCAGPGNFHGRELHTLPERLPCRRPTITSALASPNRTRAHGQDEEDDDDDGAEDEDGEDDAMAAPPWTVTLNLTDSRGHTVTLACTARAPPRLDSVTLNHTDAVATATTAAWSAQWRVPLACPANRGDDESIWQLLAYYSDVPARLRRHNSTGGGDNGDTADDYWQDDGGAGTGGVYYTGLRARIQSRPRGLAPTHVEIRLDRRRSVPGRVLLEYSAQYSSTGGAAIATDDAGTDRHGWVMIERGPAIQIIPEGGSFHLACNVTASGPAMVSWVLPGGTVLQAPNGTTNHHRVASGSTELHLPMEDQVPTWSTELQVPGAGGAKYSVDSDGGLNIHRATPDDAGVYACMASVDGDTERVTTRVHVELRHNPQHDRHEPPNVTLHRDPGNPVALDCVANADPEPHVAWFCPSGRVIANGTLRLATLHRGDAGRYTCVAVNELGAERFTVDVAVGTEVPEHSGNNHDGGGVGAGSGIGAADAPFRKVPRQPRVRGGRRRQKGGAAGSGEAEVRKHPAEGRRGFESRRRAPVASKHIQPERWADILARVRGWSPPAAAKAPEQLPSATVAMTVDAEVVAASTATRVHGSRGHGNKMVVEDDAVAPTGLTAGKAAPPMVAMPTHMVILHPDIVLSPGPSATVVMETTRGKPRRDGSRRGQPRNGMGRKSPRGPVAPESMAGATDVAMVTPLHATVTRAVGASTSVPSSVVMVTSRDPTGLQTTGRTTDVATATVSHTTVTRAMGISTPDLSTAESASSTWTPRRKNHSRRRGQLEMSPAAMFDPTWPTSTPAARVTSPVLTRVTTSAARRRHGQRPHRHRGAASTVPTTASAIVPTPVSGALLVPGTVAPSSVDAEAVAEGDTGVAVATGPVLQTSWMPTARHHGSHGNHVMPGSVMVSHRLPSDMVAMGNMLPIATETRGQATVFHDGHFVPHAATVSTATWNIPEMPHHAVTLGSMAADTTHARLHGNPPNHAHTPLVIPATLSPTPDASTWTEHSRTTARVNIRSEAAPGHHGDRVTAWLPEPSASAPGKAVATWPPSTFPSPEPPLTHVDSVAPSSPGRMFQSAVDTVHGQVPSPDPRGPDAPRVASAGHAWRWPDPRESATYPPRATEGPRDTPRVMASLPPEQDVPHPSDGRFWNEHTQVPLVAVETPAPPRLPEGKFQNKVIQASQVAMETPLPTPPSQGRFQNEDIHGSQVAMETPFPPYPSEGRFWNERTWVPVVAMETPLPPHLSEGKFQNGHAQVLPVATETPVPPHPSEGRFWNDWMDQSVVAMETSVPPHPPDGRFQNSRVPPSPVAMETPLPPRPSDGRFQNQRTWVSLVATETPVSPHPSHGTFWNDPMRASPVTMETPVQAPSVATTMTTGRDPGIHSWDATHANLGPPAPPGPRPPPTRVPGVPEGSVVARGGSRRWWAGPPAHRFWTHGQKPRIVSRPPPSAHIPAGADATFPCRATGNPPPYVTWTKTSTGALLTPHTHLQRFAVLRNGTLLIRGAQPQDRGQYACTATNLHGSDRALLTLTVSPRPPPRLADPPFPPPSMPPRPPREVTVYLGDVVSMECLARGVPPPRVTWILPDRTVLHGGDSGRIGEDASPTLGRVRLHGNGTLSVRDASFSDGGVYRCFASNAAGADGASLHLHVAVLPPVIREDASEEVSAPAGSGVHVHCSARAAPPASLRWVLADGAQVRPSQFLRGNVFVFPNGTLYIRHLAPRDAGRYECVAANAVGSAQRTVRITVTDATVDVPDATDRVPEARVRHGDALWLQCSVAGDDRAPPPRVLWRLPSTRVLDAASSITADGHARVFPNGTLLLRPVAAGDAGDYLCLAPRGPDGHADAHDPAVATVRVTVTAEPPRIERRHPDRDHKRRLAPGDDLRLDCVARGRPEPHVSWTLPDGTRVHADRSGQDGGQDGGQHGARGIQRGGYDVQHGGHGFQDGGGGGIQDGRLEWQNGTRGIQDGGGQVRYGGHGIQDGGHSVQDGGRVTQHGGGQVQYGRHDVQRGGQVIQHGGRVTQHGGRQVQYGGHDVQHGGHGIQDGGHGVQDGGRVTQHGGGQVQYGGHGVQHGGHGIQDGGHGVQDGGRVTQHGGGQVQYGGHGVQHGGHGVQDGGGVIQHGGRIIQHGGGQFQHGAHGVQHGTLGIQDGGYGIHDGADSIQYGGRGAQRGGQVTQVGGAQVQYGGHAVQHGGHGVQDGGGRVPYGGMGVQHGGRGTQHGGDQVQHGGHGLQEGGGHDGVQDGRHGVQDGGNIMQHGLQDGAQHGALHGANSLQRGRHGFQDGGPDFQPRGRRTHHGIFGFQDGGRDAPADARHARYVVFDNGTLLLHHVAAHDAGDYTCHAHNHAGHDRITVRVIITAHSTATTVTPDTATAVHVAYGDNTTIPCAAAPAVALPSWTFTWLSPAHRVLPWRSDKYRVGHDGALTVHLARRSDAGVYTCVARRPGDAERRATTWLRVRVRPPLIGGLPVATVDASVAPGSRVLLDCPADGTPPPRLLWTLPAGVTLPAPYRGGRVSVHANGTLDIHAARAGDGGNLACVARNEASEARLLVRLAVLEPAAEADARVVPAFGDPVREAITASAGHTIRVNCSAAGAPLPALEWVLPNGVRLAGGRRSGRFSHGPGGALHVSALTAADAGDYRCVAANAAGRAERVVTLAVAAEAPGDRAASWRRRRWESSEVLRWRRQQLWRFRGAGF